MNPIEDKLAELRARFILRAPDEIAAIDRAMEGGDRETLVERAHAIAGIAGLFGFAEVGETAAELEDRARAGVEVEQAAGRLRAMLVALGAA